jgi:hypothetical protein
MNGAHLRNYATGKEVSKMKLLQNTYQESSSIAVVYYLSIPTLILLSYDMKFRKFGTMFPLLGMLI